MMKKILLLMIFPWVACGDANIPPACTEEARSSVTLKIIDADTDDVLDEATIVWSVDDGFDTITACTDNDDFVDDCESFPLIYEVEGEFEITVSAEGYIDQTKTVTVEKDECHVIGESVTFKMSLL